MDGYKRESLNENFSNEVWLIEVDLVQLIEEDDRVHAFTFDQHPEKPSCSVLIEHPCCAPSIHSPLPQRSQLP